jgi:Bacterial protein of unknown function (DUF937)
MAINLVSLVSDFLTPDMVGRIASALGVDRGKLQTAISATVPGLLASISGVAAQPGGAQKLVDAAKQQSGVLGNFAGTLGAGGQTSLVEKGSQMLSSLLGGRDQGLLADAVSKFTGLSPGATGSVLGILGPLVMGTMAQHARPLDANGIASLIAGQKDNISAALPPGFSGLLGGTGLLDSLGSAMRTAVSAGNQTARAATSAAYVAGSAGQRAGETAAASTRWLFWLIPLVAIAGLLYFFARPAEHVVQQGVTAAQSLSVGGLDVGKQVTDSVATLRNTLGDVTDATTAQAALPKLQGVIDKIDQADGLVAKLTPEQRKVLAGLVNPVMPALNQLFDKVLAVPGVAELLKPTIDALKAKLTMLTA